MRGNKKKNVCKDVSANFFRIRFWTWCGHHYYHFLQKPTHNNTFTASSQLTLKSNGAKKELRTKQSHKANITKGRQKMKRLLGIWAHCWTKSPKCGTNQN